MLEQAARAGEGRQPRCMGAVHAPCTVHDSYSAQSMRRFQGVSRNPRDRARGDAIASALRAWDRFTGQGLVVVHDDPGTVLRRFRSSISMRFVPLDFWSNGDFTAIKAKSQGSSEKGRRENLYRKNSKFSPPIN